MIKLKAGQKSAKSDLCHVEIDLRQGPPCELQEASDAEQRTK
ncbi:hypothetical protein Q670_01225 [Alcanivorax sp. P2S70]|nr:hypothetical protein Q670_01225 [Alcanivorax sp. P2S70]